MRNYIIFAISLSLLWNCKPEEPIEKIGVASLHVDSDDIVWLSTEQGLRSIKDGTLKKYTQEGLNNSISSVIESGSTSKEILVGTDNGVYAVSGNYDNPGVSLKYSSSNGLLNNVVNTVGVDTKNRDWIGTIFGANYEKDGGLNDLIDTAGFKIAYNANVSAMAFLYDSYFIGTSGDYLYNLYYNPEIDAITGASQLQSEYNGDYITDSIYCLLGDSDTNIWIGSAEGLMKTHRIYTSLLNGGQEYFLDGNEVYALCLATNGNIMAGTDQGLSIYNGTSWTHHYFTDGIKGTKVVAVDQASNDNIWVGTDLGAFEFDGTNWKEYTVN